MFSILLVLALAFSDSDWTAYGHDPGGTKYSELRQIDRQNVTQLKKAWEYHTGALEPKSPNNEKAAFEATPIVVDGTMYLSTPYDQVIALDPATGREKWKYDPHVERWMGYSEVTSRGVSIWTDSKRKKGEPCRQRVFIGTIDARLIGLDAETGKVCDGLGEIDLNEGIGLKIFGNYQVTSPPAIVGDVVITGSSIGDNNWVKAERGTIRAYDARSGKLRWSFDPLPADLKTAGAANAWPPFSADPQRDLVFVPTGSSSPDFYGGLRPGNNGYADSIVALRASTGKVVWSFQTVHHDLWDYDNPSQPVLVTFRRGGEEIPAVVTGGKTGFFFVLDRRTGKSLLPVEERAVPQSSVPGEESSPTQPFPLYDTLAPSKFSADDAWGITPADREYCKSRLEGLDAKGIFTPPSLTGAIIFPGNVGGVNWGGGAYDPERGLMVYASNRLSTVVKVFPRDKFDKEYNYQNQNRFDSEMARQRGAPYAMVREHLRARDGLPCNAPPWGELIAVDFSAGRKKWQVPLGEVPLPGGKAIPGSLAMGGPMITGGGLIFIGATISEQKLRAYDIDTGRELWSSQLPASAQSTPMTYSIGGKQYVVICAGGHGKAGNKMGDSVVAFALP
jgi:quinoprotein glucose dehydrogenase